MLIPFKVKNPPKSFPVTTLAIIAINLLVFLFTSKFFLVIQDSMLDKYALKWGVSPPITLLTALFLHADIFHIAGNMLFLWVFGPAVEDRLGTIKYLILYFLAGLTGHFAQAAMGATGAIGASIPTMGASGCIMGVLGAYWYMYSWSPVCIFYFVGIFWRGVFEAAAVWVISAYFVLDVVNGFIAKSAGVSGGVANFAHVGGVLIGATLVWMLGIKRDSGDVSKVKAAQAEGRDLSMLSCTELWTLVQSSPEDESLLVGYAEKAMKNGSLFEVKLALSKDMKTILTRCPQVALHYIKTLNGPVEIFSPGDLLVLGKWCEANADAVQVLSIYGLIGEKYPDAPELGMGLYRAAAYCWYKHNDGRRAMKILDLFFSKVPNCSCALDAEDLRNNITKQAGDINAQAA